MHELKFHTETILHRGFCILPGLFTPAETHDLIRTVLFSQAYLTSAGEDTPLFSIRRLFKKVPDIIPLIFTDKLNRLIDNVLGADYFVTRATYFDKPANSNWFVPYHQDLTISVNDIAEVEGFRHWTRKSDHFSVQPPLPVLENNFSIRIHLDETGEKNGALRVIPTSHNRGIFKSENINWNRETEYICRVPEGGVMIMNPLLMHASNRSTNGQRRRVIHIELSNQTLPSSLQWAEKLERPRHRTVSPLSLTFE